MCQTGGRAACRALSRLGSCRWFAGHCGALWALWGRALWGRSQMQDIGGCGAVVSSVQAVRLLHERYKRSEIKHKLLSTDDYIAAPKTSGYRSLHLVYSYFSDRKKTHNGLRIEVQIRSSLQHAWATAVETVGTFIRQALKSSLGEKNRGQTEMTLSLEWYRARPLSS